MANSLDTTLLTSTADEAADITAGQFVARVFAAKTAAPAYERAVVWVIALAIIACARLFKIRASVVAGQILHETNYLRFGGDVTPEQFNFAGLGTTGGGVKGHGFVDAATGILAVFVHHLVYIYGEVSRWPEPFRQYLALDQRYAAALSAGHGGKVARIRDYVNGRWAYSKDKKIGTLDNGYAAAIVTASNQLLATVGDTPMEVPRIAISSGHHNTDGGNTFEIEQTGELTEAVARWCKRIGMDVRVFTRDGPDPDLDPGDGFEPLGLQGVARQVVAAANAGWRPHIYLETHTEGGGTTGAFVIFPEWGGDVDADVRDTLGPLVMKYLTPLTGLAARRAGKDGIKGVTSEQETGVGAGGSRLGIFLITAAIPDATRLIIEYGAHDKEPDLSIVKRPGFYDGAGKATALAFAEFLGPQLGWQPKPIDDIGGKVPVPENTTTQRLLAYWSTLPPTQQGDMSPDRFYQVGINWRLIYGPESGIPAEAEGLVGEYAACWYWAAQDRVMPISRRDDSILQIQGGYTPHK